jgi:lycopene beta-cyclase
VNKFDVIVVGMGPTALLAAAACAERGLSVVVITPAPDQRWNQRYADFASEINDTPLEASVLASWPAVEFVSAQGAVAHLSEAYSLIDTARLATDLRARAERAGVHVMRGVVGGADPRSAGGMTVYGDGLSVDGAVVIDATGFQPALVKRPAPTAYQTALGWRIETPGAPYNPGAMRFMDLRDAGAPPTFLYAMPHADGTWFVEETSLVATNAPSFEALADRLRARLERDGVVVTRVLETERCRIPMDTPIPDLDQPVVGFGAAGSMIHPSTGYLVTRAARTAPKVADAIVAGLSAGGPRAATRDAWRAIWPVGGRITRTLQQFGARALLSMPADELSTFFERFFALPADRWRTWMRADADPADVAATMWTLFGTLDLHTRWQVVRATAPNRPSANEPVPQ